MRVFGPQGKGGGCIERQVSGDCGVLFFGGGIAGAMVLFGRCFRG